MPPKPKYFHECTSCGILLAPADNIIILRFCCQACYEIWLTRLKEEG